MDDLLEQNIFDDDFVVFNNDIPYDSYIPENDLCYCCGMSHWGNACDKCDKLKIDIIAAKRHYELGIASKSEIALIKKKFKVIRK